MLPPKANYYLFKRGVKPAWEDEANAKGGKWSIQLPREKSRAGIDTLWLFTVRHFQILLLMESYLHRPRFADFSFW